MDVVLALVAAFFFALGLVLQEKAASSLPASSIGVNFLARLVRQPVWFLGIAAQGVGFVAQAIALGIGRMVIVQPLLIASIVFALPLGRIVKGRRISGREWLGAAIVTGGLAALLVVSKPDAGSDDAPFGRWAFWGGIALGVAAILFVLARGRSKPVRAALIGTASGVLFGLSAGLTKTVVSSLDDGIFEVFVDWRLHALVAISAVAFWLGQVALQTGALPAAVSTGMAFDALSSLFFGIVIFGEALHESALGITVTALSLAATLGGLVLLARQSRAEPSPAPSAVATA